MKRLPVIRQDCIDGTLQSGSREDRMSGRKQCMVACRKNLLIRASEDMAGRRHHNLAPASSLVGGSTSASAPAGCMDIADANPAGLSSREVGVLMGQSKRAVELTVKRALSKLKENGACDADLDAMAHAIGNDIVG